VAGKGVGFVTVTLHTGVSSLEGDEAPYEEPYAVPPKTADAVRAAKGTAGRVIAVGTTVVRALASAADEHGRVIASRGWTDIVVTPVRGMRVIDGLVPGFTEPRSTRLELMEAITG